MNSFFSYIVKSYKQIKSGSFIEQDCDFNKSVYFILRHFTFCDDHIYQESDSNTNIVSLQNYALREALLTLESYLSQCNNDLTATREKLRKEQKRVEIAISQELRKQEYYFELSCKSYKLQNVRTMLKLYGQYQSTR